MYNNILHCTYKCKIFSRLSNVCYCTAYYNIETFIFLQYWLLIKLWPTNILKLMRATE